MKTRLRKSITSAIREARLGLEVLRETTTGEPWHAVIRIHENGGASCYCYREGAEQHFHEYFGEAEGSDVVDSCRYFSKAHTIEGTVDLLLHCWDMQVEQ